MASFEPGLMASTDLWKDLEFVDLDIFGYYVGNDKDFDKAGLSTSGNLCLCSC